MQKLDDIAILQGTDKSSIENDYVRQYEREFAPFKDEEFDFLEIGAANGASLRMWEQYFTKARLVAIDVIPECALNTGGRRIVEIGSQSDITFLDGLIAKYHPSIIIDDGSHRAEDIEVTFRHLFPHLKPGGCYVIEDLHMHYEAQGFARAIGAQQFALDLANLKVRDAGAAHKEAGSSLHFVDLVDRITFIRRAAIIWRKRIEDDYFHNIDRVRDLVEKSGVQQNWFFFIQYIQRSGGDLDLAEFAARKVIDLSEGRFGAAYWRLSEVLEKKGDLSGSLKAAEQAFAVSPELTVVNQRINRLRTAMRGFPS